MTRPRITVRQKQILALLIVVLTFALFGRYIQQHNLSSQLRLIRVSTVLTIVGLYLAMICALTAIYHLSAQMCGKTLSAKENFLLTAYSSIVNFFGPLQSGPGVRAVYLNKKHAIPLKKYIAASLWYYAVFAILSSLWFLAGWLSWWQVIVATSGVAVVVWWCLRWLLNRKGGASLDLTLPRIGTLIGLVALQLLIVTVIYAVELHSLKSGIGWRQIVSYTGAANFALFVSLTPGALGFREAFLLLSRHVSHIDANTIVAANLIDRAVYIVFLGLLFCLSLTMHGLSFWKSKA